jgi:hypothetical protein
METLREYLMEVKGVNDFKGSINHLCRSLVIRTHPRKQVLINGLIGVVLGAYSMNDRKITELTNEMVNRCSELL